MCIDMPFSDLFDSYLIQFTLFMSRLFDKENEEKYQC